MATTATKGKVFTMADRAATLFVDGYKAKEVLFGEIYIVTNPAGKSYEVDTRDNSCTCPDALRTFVKFGIYCGCKHSQGLRELLAAQAHAAFCAAYDAQVVANRLAWGAWEDELRTERMFAAAFGREVAI